MLARNTLKQIIHRTTTTKRTFVSMTSSNPLSNVSPTLSLVPPGQCQFTDSFQSVPLEERIKVSPTSSVLRFGLPDPSKPLNLSTCACILAKADLKNRDSGETEAVIRPYTPISTNAQVGHFELLIKDYEEHGRLSTYLTEELQVGELVDFKHIGKHRRVIGLYFGSFGLHSNQTISLDVHRFQRKDPGAFQIQPHWHAGRGNWHYAHDPSFACHSR
jgi:hypothetical protein